MGKYIFIFTYMYIFLYGQSIFGFGTKISFVGFLASILLSQFQKIRENLLENRQKNSTLLTNYKLSTKFKVMNNGPPGNEPTGGHFKNDTVQSSNQRQGKSSRVMPCSESIEPAILRG